MLQDGVADWALSADDLDEFDVVYMESGWKDEREAWHGDRITYELAESFVRRGGQLIVADAGQNALAFDDQLKGLFGTSVREHKLSQVMAACWIRGARFFPQLMEGVGDWLTPALDGIDSILVGEGAVLQPWVDVAASGNPDTYIWTLEGRVLDTSLTSPWATVHQYGRGHAVLIGADVSDDRIVNECPDNAKWIGNLMTLLTDRSRETEGWLVRKAARSGAGAGLRGLLDQPESQQLERKSSFLASTDPKRPDIPQHVIQHNVGKSVAALANTDGGHVIIGQADDLTIVGLADDFAEITKNPGRDGFELKLVEYIKNSLDPGWVTLGLQVLWLDHDGLDIAIVEVPRSEAIVFLTDKNKKDEETVYVRSGTRSDKLTGRELSDWIKKRGRQR